jgi:hypothetical protein
MESAIKSIIANALKTLQSKHGYNADTLTADMFEILFVTSPPAIDIEVVPAPAAAPAPTEDAKALKKKESAAKAAATRAKKKETAPAPAPAPVPAAAPAEALNVAKMTKTHQKHLKTGLDASHREMNETVEKQFLDFLNALSAADFKKKKMPEHVTDFLRPPAAAVEAPVADEFGRVVFKGKVYFVGKTSKKVYRNEKDEEDEDAATVKEHVGYWNMNEFKGMEWETIEWVEEGE